MNFSALNFEDIQLTKKQKEVYNSVPNTIISGCPGTGKTILACLLAAKHSKDKSIAIITYTKSLRTFILNNITKIKAEVDVFYEYEWCKELFLKYDIIIVDEVQDFSLNDIDDIINLAKDGVYLFGDNEQQIYEYTRKKESTLKFSSLLSHTNFKHIILTDNFRIPEENRIFITALKKNSQRLLTKTNSFSGIKPLIKKFDSIENELKWILDLLKKSACKNIGILLSENGDRPAVYINKNKPIEILNPGIITLKKRLQENGIELGYKDNNYDKLVFSSDKNINIMTIHSSKGLDFDCVILPFSNYKGNYQNENLFYVALTRSNSEIIITYTDAINEEFTLTKSLNNTYTGTIESRSGYPSDPFIEAVIIRTITNSKPKQ